MEAVQHPQFGTIRTDIAPDGMVWFVAKDVCSALTIINYRDAISVLDDDEKGVGIFYTPGGAQEMLTVNESGLYALILRSNKPQARAFRKWVTAEVLPALRRTGRYELPRQQLVPVSDDPIAWVNGVLAVTVRYLVTRGVMSYSSYEYAARTGQLVRLNRPARNSPVWVSVTSLKPQVRKRLAEVLQREHPHAVVRLNGQLYLTATAVH